MTSLSDLGVAAGINVLSSFICLLAFAVLRRQPGNERVYYAKWFLVSKGRSSRNCESRATVTSSLSNSSSTLEWSWVYLHFLSWVPDALNMPESELMEHSGFDSVIFLRIYLLGIKIFVPLMLMGLIILGPINVTGHTTDSSMSVANLNMDKLSMQNIPDGSKRLWAAVTLAYVFTTWVCVVLYREYKTIMMMRSDYNDAQDRRPNQFTVLVRNIPEDPDESANLHIEHFFRLNYSNYYSSHQMVRNANKLEKLVKEKAALQNWLDYFENRERRHQGLRVTVKTGFLGVWGDRVHAVDYYRDKVENKTNEIEAERIRVLKDPKAVLPVAFVSFRGRWGAAVAAQTQQTRNPTIWLTQWAPEPGDVYWPNLSIPFVEITIRRHVMAIALFFLVFFFIIPITFVQSLANMDNLSDTIYFLRPVLKLKFINSLIQGYLPGLALKLFLVVVPWILMLMSKVEGFVSLSSLERRAASKYFIFLVISVFFGSILTGSASQQLSKMVHEPPTRVPGLIGDAVSNKALFFITYIMVDGWAGTASEILRFKPLVIYHLKNAFLVKTETDRENAMDPGSFGFPETVPQLMLYFLFGLMYSVIAPILLPFIIIFFAFAYLVYRHQIINMYQQEYESMGAFWPHVHTCVVACLVIHQISLLGLLATKKASQCTPLLLFLPILTIAFNMYCKTRFEQAFKKYPLQEAMAKDTRERVMDPNFDLKAYLDGAYLHPAFKPKYDEGCGNADVGINEEDPPLVPTNRMSRDNTPRNSNVMR